MKKFVSIVALAAAGVATPALAQEGSTLEAYAGVLVGYDSVKVKIPGESGSDDGVVYGGFLGAQTSMGDATVLGVEAEITGSTTKESAQDVFAAGDDVRLKAGRDLFVGARFGVRATPDLLVYAKGGYTNARATLRYTDATGTVEDGDNLSGYRVGAGVEFGVGQLRFRGEYRFSDYGDYKLNGVNTGLSLQRHQVVLGALYAF